MQTHATEYLMLRCVQQNHLLLLQFRKKKINDVYWKLEFKGVLVVSISPFMFDWYDFKKNQVFKSILQIPRFLFFFKKDLSNLIMFNELER